MTYSEFLVWSWPQGSDLTFILKSKFDLEVQVVFWPGQVWSWPQDSGLTFTLKCRLTFMLKCKFDLHQCSGLTFTLKSKLNPGLTVFTKIQVWFWPQGSGLTFILKTKFDLDLKVVRWPLHEVQVSSWH